METIKTIFSIDGEHYAVHGIGQQAVSTILKQFLGKRVFISGFMVNDRFVPVNLD